MPSSPSPCPSESVLLNHLEGKLSSSEERLLAEHAAACSRCDAVMGLNEGTLVAHSLGSETADADIERAVHRLSRRSFGRYELVRSIGRGGMGIVYEARDARLERSVALKILVGAGGTDQERALKEARSMARLSHPNVVQVYDVESVDGEAGVAMELVAGRTLAHWIAERPSEHAVLEMIRGIASGLAAAHDAGIVHRDLKPTNVLLDGKGRPKVSDFGLAALLASDSDAGEVSRASVTVSSRSTLAGTPPYMAPEVLAGQPADARADQYALGVCLFEALTGALPYEARTVEQARATAGRVAPVFPRTLSPTARRITERLLARAPEDRYGNLSAVIDALVEAGASPPRLRAHRPAVAVTLLLMAFASAALVAAWVATREASPEATRLPTKRAATYEPHASAPESPPALPSAHASAAPLEPRLAVSIVGSRPVRPATSIPARGADAHRAPVTAAPGERPLPVEARDDEWLGARR